MIQELWTAVFTVVMWECLARPTVQRFLDGFYRDCPFKEPIDD